MVALFLIILLICVFPHSYLSASFRTDNEPALFSCSSKIWNLSSKDNSFLTLFFDFVLDMLVDNNRRSTKEIIQQLIQALCSKKMQHVHTVAIRAWAELQFRREILPPKTVYALCAGLPQSYCIQLLRFYFSQFVDIFVILINDKKLMRLLNETLEFLTICFINNVVVKVIQLVWYSTYSHLLTRSWVFITQCL